MHDYAPAACLPIGDVGLNETEHLLGSLGHLDEDTIVDLEKTEQLQDLAGFWCNFVDTGMRSIHC